MSKRSDSRALTSHDFNETSLSGVIADGSWARSGGDIVLGGIFGDVREQVYRFWVRGERGDEMRGERGDPASRYMAVLFEGGQKSAP